MYDNDDLANIYRLEALACADDDHEVDANGDWVEPDTVHGPLPLPAPLTRPIADDNVPF
jgi:hypothetical protein